ncbi:hypothetical protein J5N97_004469 [Dioscorea zingiberensis]|uniref:Uncharacterized protein n=1 Tax=Dioscorea zingiberensis TaxID=325984 RepID=A0A9D5D6Q0_9LILI|nr:hypothetical protein J5N97_004469 [Dioscorea zingiberensis]
MKLPTFIVAALNVPNCCCYHCDAESQQPIFPLLSFARSVNPFSRLDPNFGRNLFGRPIEFSSFPPHDAREIHVEFKDGNNESGSSRYRLVIEDVSGTVSVQGPGTHGDDDDDIPSAPARHGTSHSAVTNTSNDGSLGKHPQPSVSAPVDFVEYKMVGYPNQYFDVPNHPSGSHLFHVPFVRKILMFKATILNLLSLAALFFFKKHHCSRSIKSKTERDFSHDQGMDIPENKKDEDSHEDGEENDVVSVGKAVDCKIFFSQYSLLKLKILILALRFQLLKLGQGSCRNSWMLIQDLNFLSGEHSLEKPSLDYPNGVASLLLEAMYNPLGEKMAGERSVQSLRPHSELRMVACVHNERPIPFLINLMDTMCFVGHPMCVYVLHMTELSGRADSTLVAHKDRSGFVNMSQMNAILNVFIQWEKHNEGHLAVQPFTAKAPFKSMWR